MKKRLKIVVSAILVCAIGVMTSCSHNDVPVQPELAKKSIVILYENDVHCSIDGYTKMAGLRDAINQSDTAYTAMVSIGDFLQGAMVGAYSHGQYIIDIMKLMNYDAITLGNHELDYGVSQMKDLLSKVNTTVVCANFFDYGAAQPYYAPYVIHTYGEKQVAFVGVCTSEAMFADQFAFFDKEDHQLYDLKKDEVTPLVQQAVDNALRRGADYVVLLAHLGEAGSENGISSYELVSKTKGIDVVLDGHSHSTIERHDVCNLDGRPVNVTQTGTQFAHVGKLLITQDGRMTTTLIPASEIPYENATVTAAINDVKAKMEAAVGRQIATTDYALEIGGAGGNMVRSGNSNLADLVTDACCATMGTRIGLMNGGGIRSSIPAGVITYGDVISALPFDNRLCKIEATGAELLTMLRRSTAKCPEGDGTFPQVSGMRYTIHTASHTVSDVEVLDEDGTYRPIDETRTYIVAVTEYYNMGGFYDTLKQCRQIEMTDYLLYDVLTNYLERDLGGTTGATYAQFQGRITIVND